MFASGLISIFSLVITFSTAITASPLSSSSSSPQSLTLPSNTTTTLPLTEPHHFPIPNSDLTLILTHHAQRINPIDTLVLLTQSLFSFTETINLGGPQKYQPLVVFQHKYGSAQIQMEGNEARGRGGLTPFKASQIMNGMVGVGAKIGFRRSQWSVVDEAGRLLARVGVEG